MRSNQSLTVSKNLTRLNCLQLARFRKFVSLVSVSQTTAPPTPGHLYHRSNPRYMATDSLVTDATVDPSSITLPLHFDDFLLDHTRYSLPDDQTPPPPASLMASPDAGDAVPVFTPEQQAWIENLIQSRTAPSDPSGSSSIAATAAGSGASATPSHSAPGSLGKPSLLSYLFSMSLN